MTTDIPDGCYRVTLLDSNAMTLRFKTRSLSEKIKPGVQQISILKGLSEDTSAEHNWKKFADYDGWYTIHHVSKEPPMLDHAVEAIQSDPFRWSRRFGLDTHRCGVCSRPLTDPYSRMLGIGPKCADNLNW